MHVNPVSNVYQVYVATTIQHLVFLVFVCRHYEVLVNSTLNAYVVTAVGERACITQEEHVH